MRALLTGTHTFFAARLIEEFQARGVQVTAADTQRFSCGKACRATSRRVVLPPLDRDPAGYLKHVLAELQSKSYDFVLPTFEESLLLSAYAREISGLSRLLTPSFREMLEWQDKGLLSGKCQEHGIRTPETIVLRNRGDLDQVAAMRFPIVVKPPLSANSVGQSRLRNIDELRAWSERFEWDAPAWRSRAVVQSWVPGRAVYTLMFCHEGRKLGEVIYRPLRTRPDGGGTSVHRESLHDPRLAEITEQIAADANWTGFAGLDFVYDETTSEPLLLDVNSRPTVGIALGVAAGVDWAQLVCDICEGRTPAFKLARAGVRARTRLLDFGWLMDGLTSGSFATAVSRIRGYIRPPWPLDAWDDYRGNGSWPCHAANLWHGALAQVEGWMLGQTTGQTILRGTLLGDETLRLIEAAQRPAASPLRVGAAGQSAA